MQVHCTHDKSLVGYGIVKLYNVNWFDKLFDELYIQVADQKKKEKAYQKKLYIQVEVGYTWWHSLFFDVVSIMATRKYCSCLKYHS